MANIDFDTSVEGAWRTFRGELADRLVGLEPGDEVVVEQSREVHEGSHATLTFTATRAHRLRATIRTVDLLSAPGESPTPIEAAGKAGWRVLRDGRTIYEVSRRRVDELAQVAVAALREIWEVVHPAFLAQPEPAPVEPVVSIGVVPESRDHLLRLVVGALEEIAGGTIVLDEDGDIPLPTGELRSWLHVMADDPAIEFFGTLVDEVPDAAAAAEFIAAEAVGWTGIKLVLHQSTVMVFLTVEMRAFCRENLVSALARWLGFMHDAAPDIVAAIKGADAPEPTSTDDDQLPDELQTLIVLDEDGQSLDAHDVATICRFDRSAILRYFRTTQEQYLEWMKSARAADAAGDPEEAAACRHEEEAWRVTARKLQDALRIVALPDDGDVHDREPRPTR
ncbi:MULTISPECIES: T3SS (YopN, CesT) and YbjN peptide-binding chaperone 1 [unclassified Gordonia (in: high G+C Gram-positive bacteria)]